MGMSIKYLYMSISTNISLSLVPEQRTKPAPGSMLRDSYIMLTLILWSVNSYIGDKLLPNNCISARHSGKRLSRLRYANILLYKLTCGPESNRNSITR